MNILLELIWMFTDRTTLAAQHFPPALCLRLIRCPRTMAANRILVDSWTWTLETYWQDSFALTTVPKKVNSPPSKKRI